MPPGTLHDACWAAFSSQLDEAESEFAQGRPEAFKALWSQGDDVSVYGAFGGLVTGWREVARRLDWASSQMRQGSRGCAERCCVVSQDLAYIAQREWIRSCVGGAALPSITELRVTMVFRREALAWRVVHRHADPLVHTLTPNHN
jgi:SnoaL-like domain